MGQRKPIYRTKFNKTWFWIFFRCFRVEKQWNALESYLTLYGEYSHRDAQMEYKLEATHKSSDDIFIRIERLNAQNVSIWEPYQLFILRSRRRDNTTRWVAVLPIPLVIFLVTKSVCVCVCACACGWVKEREWERKRERKRKEESAAAVCGSCTPLASHCLQLRALSALEWGISQCTALRIDTRFSLHYSPV